MYRGREVDMVGRSATHTHKHNTHIHTNITYIHIHTHTHTHIYTKTTLTSCMHRNSRMKTTTSRASVTNMIDIYVLIYMY